jgi:hypothetical protein
VVSGAAQTGKHRRMSPIFKLIRDVILGPELRIAYVTVTVR